MVIQLSEMKRTILMIWIIMVSGVWSIRLPPNVTVVINIVIAFHMLLRILYNRKYNNIHIALLLSTILALGFIYNNDTDAILTYGIIFAYIIFGLYFSNFWNIEKFATKYCNIMSLITTVSLICYFFRDYLSKIPGNFPIIQGQSVSYINYYVYLYSRELPDRNSAVFWEPGAFVVFLAIALYFKLFIINENSLRENIFYIIALLTTKSTLAYTVILLIILVRFLEIPSEKKYIRKMVLGALTFMFLIQVMLYVGAFDNIQNKIFIGFNSNASTRARNIAQLMDLKIIGANPVLGVGFKGYQQKVVFLESFFGHPWTVAANTFTYMSALFGIPYFLVTLKGLVGLKKKDATIIVSILYSFFLIWIFVPQNFVQKPIFYILVFWGYNLSRSSLRPVKKLRGENN